MPLDPLLVADTRAWLTRVSYDLRAAAHDLTAQPPLAADALFHVQQAVEKAFKAFLTWHEIAFRKTHSLEELGTQCEAVDATLHPLVDRAVPLTEYAFRLRYPGDDEEPTVEEAAAALSLGREILAALLARLPSETGP